MEIKFSGENFKDVFDKIKNFALAFEKKANAAVVRKGRRKMTPGEHLGVEPSIAEVIEAFKQVSEHPDLGSSYVDIILSRIPASSTHALKPSEYSRTIRLCRHYLEQKS